MFQANFTVTPLTGSVLATEFTTSNLTSGGSVEKYIWDFGTGNLVYDTETPKHIYNYPGTYTITLTAINFDGIASSASQQVTVDLAYRDYLRFTQIPEKFPDPGKLTTTPFKFEVISSNPDKPLVVDLFATNSKSIPYQYTSERWVFLTPTWKFLDKNFTPITSLSVASVPVYVNNVVVAVSGTGEFYYTDSSSNGDPTQDCPILITATLQTSGFSNPNDSSIYPYESYANNKTVRSGVIWQVNDLTPTLLKVTGNYVDEIYFKQWDGIQVPVLITAHSNRSQILPGSDDSISEVIFTYPSTNTIGSQAPLTLTLTDLASSLYTVEEAPLNFQATDKSGLRSGGYVFTTITPLTTINQTTIVAQTTANTGRTTNSNTFSFPFGYAPNTSVWVSNPEKNTLNKITLVPDPGNCATINYFKDNGILVDGIVKEVTVPALSTSSTFNYQMSGFSGIYGVAIDPRNYDLIAADAELDTIYRFSNTGEILKTFPLSTLDDYDPYQKFFHSWSWKTIAQEASSTRFAFYTPVPVSPRFENYIVTVGGLLQPPNTYEVNVYDSTFRLLVSPSSSADYPEEDLKVEVMQIFHPSLPQQYLNSQRYWVNVPTNNTTTTILLSGTEDLSPFPNYYIVTVDGIQQLPNTYSINPLTRLLTFTSPLPQFLPVVVLYLPDVQRRTWIETISTPATAISFNRLADFGPTTYNEDENCGYLVNVGGVIQAQKSFTVDYTNKQIIFSEPIQPNVIVGITQFYIPEKVQALDGLTPAYVSLDKQSNIWVSLFNSVSVLKFDPDLNLLFSTVPNNIGWQKRTWTVPPEDIDYQSSRYENISRMVTLTALPADIYTNEFFLKPPAVETDKENNCWATYAHPLCSMLVKYSSTGEPLLEIPTGPYSTPTYLAINSQNNVWVSNSHGSSYTYTALSGNLQLYNTTNGNLLQTVTGMSRPSHIALDRNNNIWFTHSLRKIGYYNTQTSTLCSWILNLTGGFTPYITPSSVELFGQVNIEDYENEENEELGGLAVDVYNRVWVLDSVNNYAWVLSATPFFLQAPIRYFKIVPDVTLGYYLDINTGSTYTESGDFYYKSAQATGDWTGNRWYQKYAEQQNISSIPISGISAPFIVDDFINRNQIRRVNESFNAAAYLKQLALPEIFSSNTKLFDEFFAAAAGTGYLSGNEDPGQTIYEKIANFVKNHSDVDTCNIDQLLSLAEQTAVAASDYSAVYPTDIRNMLDIASVPRTKLWGIKDEVPLLTQSIGTQYNTQTDLLTAGTKIILKNKYDSSLSLLSVPPLSDGTMVYNFQDFQGYGLINPTLNYLFYRFNPAYTENYVENIIDWQSPFTTLSPTASTLNEWYGEGGSIEEAFRYLLTKNLFL